MAEQTSGTSLFDMLVGDTNKAIATLEAKAKTPQDMEVKFAEIEQKFEAASKIKNERDRTIRLKVLEAELGELQKDSVQEQEDLAQAVFGLNGMLESMGREYAELGGHTPEEQALVTTADIQLKEGEQQKVNASQKWNVLGARDRAIVVADTAIELAKQAVQEAKNESARLARQRLLKADIEGSLQEFMLRVGKTVDIMQARMGQIQAQLTAVGAQKIRAFEAKEQAAMAIEKLDGDLDTSEADLRHAEELLTTYENGSAQHVQQEKIVTGLRAQVEDLRGRRNTAFSVFQSKEKFAEELEIHERSQMKLRDNQRMWIVSLKSDTEERQTTFRSRLEAMKAASDQDIARQLDDLGAAVDQSNADYMARVGSASDRIRMEKMEKHPERVTRILETQAAQAEAIHEIRMRERTMIELFKERYNYDPTKSSFFSYEEGGGSEEKGVEKPAGVF